jgi:hypothetical protein
LVDRDRTNNPSCVHDAGSVRSGVRRPVACQALHDKDVAALGRLQRHRGYEIKADPPARRPRRRASLLSADRDSAGLGNGLPLATPVRPSTWKGSPVRVR